MARGPRGKPRGPVFYCKISKVNTLSFFIKVFMAAISPTDVQRFIMRYGALEPI